jgi:hypothetical protein
LNANEFHLSRFGFAQAQRAARAGGNTRRTAMNGTNKVETKFRKVGKFLAIECIRNEMGHDETNAT